jgi:uncharacterized protein
MRSASRFAGAAVLLLAGFTILAFPAKAFGDELASGRAALAAGDHAEALRLLLPLAQRGDTAAQASVGEMYANGQGVPKDLAEAERWLARPAAQGDDSARAALLDVGRAYFHGNEVPQQCTRAVEVMRGLVDMAYLPAFASLSATYARGCGEVPVNLAEAVRLARVGAEKGDGKAQAQLGWMYASGSGLAQDYGEAMRWSRKAAEQGVPEGEATIGAMYMGGYGVPKDLAEAERWLAKSVAQGNETARMNLLSIARAYRDGVDVPQQCTRAVEIMKRLFSVGHWPAFESLAKLYVKGCSEIAANPAEAFRMASESAEKGDLAGQVALGYAYVSGVGVPRNYGEAMRWYRKAADRGSSQGQADVGVMYLMGEGVQRDLVEAERWFAMSAAQGNERGKYGLVEVASAYAAGVQGSRNCARAIGVVRPLADTGYAPASAYLGKMYLRGCDEVAANVPEGILLTRKHAEAGDRMAQATLGWAYATGTGVAKDFGEAMRWSRKSADQGWPEGQVNVGMLYHFGQGVDRDPAEAKRWLELAAAQGDPWANELLTRVEATGSPENREAALRAAAVRMSASELARGYLVGKTVQDMLKLAEAGATVVLPERRITRENVAQAKEEYRNREQVLAAVIRERGFRNIAGLYRATPDPACDRAQSAWTAGLSASDSHEVEIRQEGFIATIAQQDQRGMADMLNVLAVVVESALAFADPMNSDYPIVGVIEDTTIAVHPDVDIVLRAWPAWAGPPSREALASCKVTLTRIAGAPEAVEPAKPAERTPETLAGATVRRYGAALPSAHDLAAEYAAVLSRRKLIAAFLSGEMVHYPPKPNAMQEYEREKQALDAREKALDAAIRERGFRNLAGRYQAKAPQACKQVHSRWAAAVSDGEIRDVEIRQEGYVVTVQNRGPRASTATGVVVESTLVLPNPMGTGYPFLGNGEDGIVALRPDIDPIFTRGTSMLAGAPSAQALSACVVTLARVP